MANGLSVCFNIFIGRLLRVSLVDKIIISGVFCVDCVIELRLRCLIFVSILTKLLSVIAFNAQMTLVLCLWDSVSSIQLLNSGN